MLTAYVFMDFYPQRLQFGLYGFESLSRHFKEVTATELCRVSTPLGWHVSVTFSNPTPPPWGTAVNRKHSTDAVTGRRDDCGAESIPVNYRGSVLPKGSSPCRVNQVTPLAAGAACS